MAEESEGYHADYSVARDCNNHRERSADVSYYEQDNEDLKRLGLDACRIYHRLIEEVVDQLCEAEDGYEDGCEQPEVDVKSYRGDACVFDTSPSTVPNAPPISGPT